MGLQEGLYHGVEVAGCRGHQISGCALGLGLGREAHERIEEGVTGGTCGY